VVHRHQAQSLPARVGQLLLRRGPDEASDAAIPRRALRSTLPMGPLPASSPCRNPSPAMTLL
jgi:hypothetical protein